MMARPTYKLGRWQRLRLWWAARKYSVYRNAWALWIGILSVFTGVYYLVDPEALLRSNALAETLKTWAYAWNILYLIGGLGIVYGLLKPNRSIDVAGLAFFAGAVIINAVAVMTVRGPAGASGAVLFGFAIAAIMRLRAVLKGGI